MAAQTELKRAWPPKKSNKPPVLKQEVITRRLAKQNKSLISRDLGISRNTVTAIINESNTDQLVESGRIQVCGLIPESIRVVKHRLERNSETAAFKVLEGIGVLGPEAMGKGGRQVEAHLTLAIQNLMGSVIVQNANETAPISVAETQSQAKPQEPQQPAITAEVLPQAELTTDKSST